MKVGDREDQQPVAALGDLTPEWVTVTVSEDGLEARVKWADGTEDCYRKGLAYAKCPCCGQPAPPTSA
jgi:hypothetical protein